MKSLWNEVRLWVLMAWMSLLLGMSDAVFTCDEYRGTYVPTMSVCVRKCILLKWSDTWTLLKLLSHSKKYVFFSKFGTSCVFICIYKHMYYQQCVPLWAQVCVGVYILHAHFNMHVLSLFFITDFRMIKRQFSYVLCLD